MPRIVNECPCNRGLSTRLSTSSFVCSGLGIPWTLSGLIYKEDLAVDSDNLMPLTLFLFGTVFGVYFATMLSGWQLSTPLGMFFFSLYFIFVAYQLAHEFAIISF